MKDKSKAPSNEYNMNKLISSLMTVLVGVSTSYGGTIDPNTPDDKYIDYGTEFHCVVRLSCTDNETILPTGGINISWASAVVIDPNWIITAAHVVEDSHDWSVSFEEKEHEIKKVFIHPEYKKNELGYNDIALGYLEKEIKIDCYPSLYQNSDEVGKICSLVGYGFAGTFDSGIVDSDGKKRAGLNAIDRTEKKRLVCSPSKENKTELEFLIANGDSGGGLFIGNELAGIHSSIMAHDGTSNSSYSDESAHTRISLFHEWIKKRIKNGSEK